MLHSVGTWNFVGRSEEHTSELQSRLHLVCRLLLEKKKTSLPQNVTLSHISDELKIYLAKSSLTTHCLILKFTYLSGGHVDNSTIPFSAPESSTYSYTTYEYQKYLDQAGITTARLLVKSKWTTARN